MPEPTSFPGAGPGPGQPEQNQNVLGRYAGGLETACRPLGGAKVDPWPARILDLSPRGVPEALLRVALPGSGNQPPGNVLARVRHVRQVEGGWLAGCAFAATFRLDELAALV